MKIAIMSLAYYEERMIRHFVKHYKPIINDIFILQSTIPWHGQHNDQLDMTGKYAQTLGAKVIQDHWKSETEQRNWGLKYLKDYDWVLILDPDEFILYGDLENFCGWLRQAKSIGITANMDVYWKKGYKLIPPDTHQPLVAVRPAEIDFIDKRTSNCLYPQIAPVKLHHASWMRTDIEVWNKINHYAHAIDFNIVDWYNRVWLKWAPEMHDLHPTTPFKWIQAIPATQLYSPLDIIAEELNDKY